MIDHDDDTDYVRLVKIDDYTIFTTDDDDEVDVYGPYVIDEVDDDRSQLFAKVLYDGLFSSLISYPT